MQTSNLILNYSICNTTINSLYVSYPYRIDKFSMTKIKHVHIIAMGLLLMSAGCQKDNIMELGDCNLKNFVKSVVDTEGTIWYDTQANAYSVFVGIEGTYDSQDIGIACNLPDNFKTDGLKILFNGRYFECEEFVPLMPGQTYYHLELAKIKSIAE